MTGSNEREEPRRRRMVWWGAGASAVLVGLGLVLGAINLHATTARLPVVPAGHFQDRTQATLQDLAFLRRLPVVDPSFSSQARRAFYRQLDALAAEASTLDLAAFEMGSARAVALADNGHTSIRGALVGRSLNAVPVRYGWFADGLYVLQADPQLAALVGGRVIDLDGRSPEALTRALKLYIGGSANLARILSANLLASPQALHAAGLATLPNQERLTVQRADGTRLTRMIGAEANSIMDTQEGEHLPSRDLSPIRAAGDARPWTHVLDGRAKLPLYLQNPDLWYWRTYPEPDTLFVELRHLRNQGATRLDQFLKAVTDEAAARKVRFAIVDLRASPGGDDMLTAAFTRRLPAVLPKDGKLFILTGPETFSAGIVTAARLKVFARGRAVIAGETIGDRERFWAEGGTAVLPNSGLRLRYATALHDWRSGCALADITVCYWRNYLDGVAAGDLTPRPYTVVRFADYAAGRDPVMDAIATLKQEPDAHVEP